MNICYTVISGPYDDLHTPTVISEGWEYICFTDQNITSKVWKIVPIPKELDGLSEIKCQRCLKIQPHKYLPGHDWSVYIDANITIKTGMWKLVNEICGENEFSVPQHYKRDCIYDERKACMLMKKDNGIESEAQIKRYKEEGYPAHYGLNETNLLIRHNVDWVQKLDELWWNELYNGSHRDQLSFNYCVWKTNSKINSLPATIVRNSAYFQLRNHNITANITANVTACSKANLLIIHFNTPELTTALYKSICKFMPNSEVYMFDNSTTQPFPHEEFPEIHYIDNTKSQIINFDVLLKKYPNHVKSAAKTNNWGSAKHTYTIEWCLQHLPVNDFILLDSDILLKQSLLPWCDNRYVYAGKVIRQPNSTIDRVAPFVCYINSSLCKKFNIHYFDDRYMHGLGPTTNRNADKYDTGAGFYLNALGKPSKRIDWEDYAVHFKAGSWLDESNAKYKENKVADNWLEEYAHLWK